MLVPAVLVYLDGWDKVGFTDFLYLVGVDNMIMFC